MLWLKQAHQPYDFEVVQSDVVSKLASILHNKPAVVGGIVAELRRQGVLAASPARAVTQIAVATRFGNGVRDGIFVLKALSLPVFPVKLYGPKDSFWHMPAAGEKGLFGAYAGFMTKLSLLEQLPEEHSFVDLFELLLIGAKEGNGDKSILEKEEIELKAAVIFEQAVTITLGDCKQFCEHVKYFMPEEVIRIKKNAALFTGNTIALLSTLTERPF